MPAHAQDSAPSTITKPATTKTESPSSATNAAATNNADEVPLDIPPIVPHPYKLSGFRTQIKLPKTTNIYITPDNPENRAVGVFLAAALRQRAGVEAQVLARPEQLDAEGAFLLTTAEFPETIAPDGYELISLQGVLIRAKTPEGLFHGVQSVIQLLRELVAEPASPELTKWEIRTVLVGDQPRCNWRGVYLDAPPQTLPIERLKRYIDYMAQLKINKLHLELAGADGWRVAFGSAAAGEKYTEEEIRHLVAFARNRYVEIVPSVTLHSGMDGAEAVAALTDICMIFGEGHIGVGWSADQPGDDARRRVVLREVADFLSKCGQPAVVTADFEGALPDNAIVLAAGNATTATHVPGEPRSVILSPDAFCDWTRGQSPIRQTSGATDQLTFQDVFNLRASLPPAKSDQATRIIGAVARIQLDSVSPDDIDALLFPRLCTFAEILWAPGEKGWPNFAMRMRSHSLWLEEYGLKYYPVPPRFVTDSFEFTQAATIIIENLLSGGTVHFTGDGTEPTADSFSYAAPTTTNQTRSVRARLILPDGRMSEVVAAEYVKAGERGNEGTKEQMDGGTQGQRDEGTE